MPHQSLKKRNLVVIGAVVAADAIFMAYVLFGLKEIAPGFSITTLLTKVVPPLLESSLASAAFVLLNSLIPSKAKAVLVFWRARDVLPGHRAFTAFLDGDPRVDRAAIEKDLGTLPTNPKEQNAAWYKLLKKHEYDPRVEEAHQQFLLFRDLAAISVLPMPFILGAIATGALQTRAGLWGIAALLIQYLACAVAARNHGNSLVSNVLAVHSVSVKAKRASAAKARAPK